MAHYRYHNKTEVTFHHNSLLSWGQCDVSFTLIWLTPESRRGGDIVKTTHTTPHHTTPYLEETITSDVSLWMKRNSTNYFRNFWGDAKCVSWPCAILTIQHLTTLMSARGVLLLGLLQLYFALSSRASPEMVPTSGGLILMGQSACNGTKRGLKLAIQTSTVLSADKWSEYQLAFNMKIYFDISL